MEDFKKVLASWVDEAGGGEVEYISLSDNKVVSSIDPDDKWWRAITGAVIYGAFTL